MPTPDSPVVSTQWLADYLGNETLVVVDASVVPYTKPNGRGGYLSGHEQYLVTGHVPGAVFADLIEEFSDPEGRFPFTRPGLDQFERAAGALGIDNDSCVVIYDSAVGQWAARLWWLFRAFGYDRVAVLNGGLTKWIAEERLVDVGHVEPTPATFLGEERPELWGSKAEVEAIAAGEASAALVCGLPPREFAGEAGTRPRLGHIPGSISVPASHLVDRETNALLPPPALRARLEPALGAERVVVYCAAGIAAAADALALTVAGHTNVALYDGSLNEWAADADAPLVTAG